MDKRQIMNNTNRVFNTPIEVQTKTVTQNKYGVELETWEKKYKLFANVKNLYGKEYELARQDNAQKTIKLILKSGIDIDTSMRIVFNGKVYDIEHIDNINYSNELLEVRAVERFNYENKP